MIIEEFSFAPLENSATGYFRRRSSIKKNQIKTENAENTSHQNESVQRERKFMFQVKNSLSEGSGY